MAKPVTDPVSSMTSEEAFEFVRKLQKAFPKTPRSKKELAALQKYLAKYKDAELRAVGSRVLSDLMQRPPRTIKASAPIAGPEPNVGPKPKARRAPKRTTSGTKPRGARHRTKRR
jgi:hypothetical protein